MTFHECCRAVIAAAEQSPNAANLQFAAKFARGGLSLTSPVSHRAQARSILANIRYWRNEEAREVRRTLREL